jgi:hypothetical protein
MIHDTRAQFALERMTGHRDIDWYKAAISTDKNEHNVHSLGIFVESTPATWDWDLQ